MAPHPVETYISELLEIRSTGGAVPETSYYPPLAALLNEVGRRLKPRVRCVSQVANTGSGSPDFGLYNADQFQKSRDGEPTPGAMPTRGVVEVKPFKDDSWLRATGKQVTKYWGHYGQVLVTNYRDFVFVGRDEHNSPVVLETFRFVDTDDEQEFWAAAGHPRKLAAAQGERLIEYLTRVMLHGAPLSDPAVLAKYLASYAREARARIDAKGELPGLVLLRKSLEEALGMQFEGDNGEHFFRATLVQTLFYGVFSAWVLWARQQPQQSNERFKWHEAIWTLHVPMIAALFHQIADPRRLKDYGLNEVLDWTEAALNRVIRTDFFERFEEQHAVQYFYEPFLKEYDPELRKDLGVWYTPPEIVQYQVARVDAVLREELDIADGLADPNVVILDPCCGTGAYLVEVLRKIHETLEAKGGHGLMAQQLKQAAMKRVFGFEILPAPFVISHLQLGLLLRSLGAPLKEETDERAGVYLTNALTGWEPPKKPKDELPFPEMQDERDKADEIKRDTPILVVIGNPPYNAYAGTCTTEEQGLVEPYKEGLTKPVKEGGWGIKKFNLDDLYVRFFRIAERRIVKSGKGVVCFISNFSYLSDPSFVVMRQRFLGEFDKLWFDCLNGDSRETGKQTPDGKPDPSAFSTEHNREGIRVGTTISLMVCKAERDKKPVVRFRHFWGAKKREDLIQSLGVKRFDKRYEIAKSTKVNRYSFVPQSVSKQFLSWPRVPALSAIPSFNGPVERRGNSLIVMTDKKDELIRSLKLYLDPRQTDETVRLMQPLFMRNSGEFVANMARKTILKEYIRFNSENIQRYPFKPFDVRLAYLDASLHPLFSRPSPQLLQQNFDGNKFFLTRDTADKYPEGPPFLFSSLVCDYDCISGHARHFPIMIRDGSASTQGGAMGQLFVFEETTPYITTRANLSPRSRAYLARLDIKNPDKDAETAGLIWMHALAIGYAPAYLSENADGIRQDWPRIPLPDKKDTLLESAELGRQVAVLLDTEKSVPGVTAGAVRPELRSLGTINGVGKKTLNPDDGDLDLTAGWGHGGQGGVTMPGRGRSEEREYTEKERAAIEQGAAALGLTLDQALERLGATTVDVYLNGAACWTGIPAAVWNFYIGGYQVIKKWLSYREKALLGRGLTMEEALYVTEMVRRLAALCLLQPALDTNYQAVKAETYPWPQDARPQLPED